MSNHFYVYMLLDPRRLYLPFYIGKGSGRRIKDHFTKSAALRDNPFKASVIKKIIESGLEPKTIIWQDGLAEQEAFDLEIELIARFGRRDRVQGILTNLTNGGGGLAGKIFSEEHKQRIAKAHQGKKHTTETKKKLSEIAKGRRASEETKKKLSAIRKGTKTGELNHMFGRKGELHPNYGKPGNIGNKNGMYGRHHSEETRKKLSEIRINQNHPGPPKGVNAPNADRNIYIFTHVDHGSLIGTIFEVAGHTGLPRSQFGNLKRGACKSYHGWRFVGQTTQEGEIILLNSSKP